MLAERDRISLPTSPERWRANWLRAVLVEIPIDGWIALQSCQLTNIHRDPADHFHFGYRIGQKPASDDCG